MGIESVDLIALIGMVFLVIVMCVWVFRHDCCGRGGIIYPSVVNEYPIATIASECILPVAKEVDRRYLGPDIIENG